MDDMCPVPYYMLGVFVPGQGSNVVEKKAREVSQTERGRPGLICILHPLSVPYVTLSPQGHNPHRAKIKAFPTDRNKKLNPSM